MVEFADYIKRRLMLNLYTLQPFRCGSDTLRQFVPTIYAVGSLAAINIDLEPGF